MNPVLGADVDLAALLDGCVENLVRTYRDDGVFPYTSWNDGLSIECSYDHPQTLRYTINSLLGLEEAARASVTGISTDRVAAMRDTFVRCQYERLDSIADLGLLTLALTATDETHRAVLDDVVTQLDRALQDPSAGRLDMQSLSWVVWGCCAAASIGVARAERVARAAMRRVSDLVVPETGLPRHSTRRHRRSIVSFGSLVYFLRACYECSRTFDDETARRLFESGVRRATDFQGPQGEWPWMIDVSSGVPFDVYPVFSVHQDSMSMLFLLPALDGGNELAADSARRSIAWCYGQNELGATFYRPDPFFFAYRSIERVERVPRLRRYVRGVTRRRDTPAAPYASANVRLNRECRSYHLGWILYVWASRAAIEAGIGSSAARVTD